MTPAVRIAPAVVAIGVWALAMEGYIGRAVAQHPPAKQAPAVAKKAAAVAKESPAVEKDDPGGEDDPLGANAACYVCHTSFVKEDLAKTHLAAKVGCIKCHGLSAKHANDENIGATKPDIFFKRGQIDAACVKCHEEHDVLPEKIIARFIERKVAKTPVVCTDCHGAHKIDAAERKN
ncbi:MAG: cytochrome c3 family protein [Thermoguttaceae bacterium]